MSKLPKQRKKQSPNAGGVPRQGNKIKIPHRRSPHFTTGFGSNIALTGPLANGLYQIDFVADAVALESETGIRVNDGRGDTYNLSYQENDTTAYRENVGRFYVPVSALRELRSILNSRLDQDSDSDEK